MKTGIIDCGTNTFNLLIRDTDGSILYNDKIPVKLGEGGLNRSYIHDEPMQRGLDALKKHRQTCLEYDVDQIFAFATSAVRSASNGQQFIDKAREQCSININLIDGQKEAELIYNGVTQAVDLDEKNILIMDIGGGSTEFIIANQQGIIWKHSYDIGSSRLMEKFRPSDPIKEENLLEINSYLEEQLQELFDQGLMAKPDILIGSSGSFDTLADMTVHRFHQPEILEGKTSFSFDMYEYRTIADLMYKSDLETRLNTPGMVPMRADLIVVACVLIDFVLDRLNINKMQQSAFALKEGVFTTLENNSIKWQGSL